MIGATLVLSIVLVNSDGSDDTLNCLESIYRHPPHVPFEAIVIDNRSLVPCLSLIEQRFPQARTCLAPSRQGFAKNYNLGIRLARGQYVLILNNDTLVHAGALDSLLSALQNNPQYGFVGPRLLTVEGEIQTVCARPLLSPQRYVLALLLLDLGLPTGRLYDAYRRRRLQKRRSGPVPCLSGACLLAARDTLDRVGLLDESYDFYFEDVEWCHRAQKSGRPVAYIAEAAVTHLGDQSLSKAKVRAKQSEFRSALRYFSQYYHFGLWQARSIWVVTMLSFLMRLILFKISAMLTRRPGYAREYAELLWWIRSRYPVAVHAANVVLAGETDVAEVVRSDHA